MGIGIFVIKTNFHITAKHLNSAWNSMKGLAARTQDFAFVHNESIITAPNVIQAFSEWRWLPETDNKGNIIEINFTGEKLGDEQILFDEIAPFVESGSSIIVADERGKVWRWRFDDGKCHYEVGKITF